MNTRSSSGKATRGARRQAAGTASKRATKAISPKKRAKSPTPATAKKARPRRVNVARFGFDGPIADNVKLPKPGGGLHAPAPEPDYPAAIGFVKARHFAARTSRTITQVVIHITDGVAKDCRRTAEFFRSGETTASAHYVVGQDGKVIQCVREKDVAFHGHDANSSSIGIEHQARTRGELKSSDPGMEATEEQYLASARLVYSLCAKYGLPLHIAWLNDPARRPGGPVRGHHEADSKTTHTNCPEGKKGTSVAWKWERYKAVMKQVHLSMG